MYILVAMMLTGGFAGGSKVDAYHKLLTNKAECQKVLEAYKKEAAKPQSKQSKIEFRCFEWRAK